MSGEGHRDVEEKARGLRSTLDSIIDDPSIPEETKIKAIIHLTALLCAIVAIQPLPFADLFLLSPIQLVMVTAMNRVMGGPVRSDRTKELLASLLGVVGWGVLAQHLILGLYKTILPFLGAVTTMPLVYAATAGLGYGARTLLDARRRDQEVSEDEVKRIATEAREQARREKRDWSVKAMTDEIATWRARAQEFEDYKVKWIAAGRELDALAKEKATLEDQLRAAVTSSEVQEVVEENDRLRERVQDAERRSDAVHAKQLDKIKSRFRKCYPNLDFREEVLKVASKAHFDELHALERQLGLLNYNPGAANFRDTIQGTKVDEIGFGSDGRVYVFRQGPTVHVVRLGDKGTQKADIEWLRNHFHPPK